MANLILLGLVLAAFISCGSKLPFAEKPPIIKFETFYDTLPSGELMLSSGETVRLDELKSKPYILILAGETCSTCLEEAIHLKELFIEKNALPKNVDLYTLILGGYIEDADFWAQNIGVNWPYGVDLNTDQIFKTYCTGYTPCVLAVYPELNRYTRFVGETSILDWQKETLIWEF